MKHQKTVFKIIFASLFMLTLVVSLHKSSYTNFPELTPASLLKDGVYTNREKGYSIKFPLWWTVEELNQGEQIKASRTADNSKDTFQEKVSLSIVKSEQSIPLDLFFRENVKGLKELFKFQEIKKGEISLNQTTAKWILYSFQPDSLKTNVQILQYFLVKNRQTCILTFISTPSHFNQYKKQFQEIAQSFELK